jgi:signal transduction histidine kinase
MSSAPLKEEVGRAAHTGVLPALVVVFALLALVVAPIPFRERANELREQIEQIAHPADDAVAEVQYLLARQNSSLRGYLIAQDSIYLEQFAELAGRARRLHAQLDVLAADLSPEIAADIAELSTLSAQWHDRLNAQQFGSATGAAAVTVGLEQNLYRESLEAANRAIQSIRQWIRERQAQIDSAEAQLRLLYLFLFLVAAAAAFAVAVLNARIRMLAARAEARRRQVESAMLQTERAVAARADLIRGFTHDVKNPLGVADGYSELLELGLRGEMSPRQLETIGRIRNSIQGATEIINELLDLSRLEGGGLQVKRERVDLTILIHELIDEHSHAAESKGLALTPIKTPGSREKVVVYTDPDRIRQILQNLISNAMKYTPAPGDIEVAVEVARPADDGGGAWARICVTDSGPGIPGEEQERIFNEFHRVPGSQGGGHGLGLAISRRIANLLGGDVTIQSVLGEGATFILTLPLRGRDEPQGSDTRREDSSSGAAFGARTSASPE